MAGPSPIAVPYRPVARVFTVLLLLFGFLVGVKALGEGFEQLGDGTLEVIFAATQNPFIGLIVGILATTVVQSSSVTTAMIVGLVAAPESPLPLANAVPMVMGANIGTTVTATFVSLAHMGRRDEFERAFPVAVCRDLFNYVAVLAGSTTTAHCPQRFRLRWFRSSGSWRGYWTHRYCRGSHLF